jgi:hypothetical protein
MCCSRIITLFIMAVCFSGCTNPTPSPKSLAPLTPTLPEESPVAVVVIDKRPAIETERTPSGEYLYSGALFAVEGHEKTVATDITNIIFLHKGAKQVYPTSSIPQSGPAIQFEITHWYSRTLLVPEKAPLIVTGEFSGILTMYIDGEPIAAMNVTADGISTLIDTYIVSEKEKEETPKLIWDAMLNTANSAQQEGYLALHTALLNNWGRF